MNNLDDTEIVVGNDSVVAVRLTEDDSRVHHINYDNKEKENVLLPAEEHTSVRLLGNPLIERGPYTFYSAFAYHVKHKSHQCKQGIDNDLYSCHVGSSSSPLLCSEWSVLHMNNFYAVRPWYNKQNGQKLLHQKHSSKFTSTVTQKQSVCIAELELLWRDDEISTSNIKSSSSFKKHGRNKMAPTSLTVSNDIISNNLNHGVLSSDKDDDKSGNCANNNGSNLLLLPHPRTLPRRKRQPSAKKLEAIDQLLQHSFYRRSQLSSLDSTSVPSVQYKHSNILCSVRLYVMPDQTATGRLRSVHGEDEVLEINTGIEGSWPNSICINGMSFSDSSRIDDFDNNGNHSSKTLPTSSGLILRVEDFVDWVLGGLMNDENENEDSQFSHEPSESKCIDGSLNVRNVFKTEQFKEKNEQQLNLLPLTSIESSLTIAMDNVKMERKNVNSKIDKIEKHNNNSYYKSIVKEAIKIEQVSLAAAIMNEIQDRCVNNHCRPDLVNNRNTPTTKHNYLGCKMKENFIKQQLVIMSYARYCRYRANLQRRRDEQLIEEDTTRVLFCRDTYDYPVELLDPFSNQNLTQKNTAALVNHMAPKLKGWPAHPASWTSFRWNRVRRRLRHLEHGSNDNNEQRRRHRYRKLKKKCRRQNLAGGALAVMSYSSSSSEDDHSDSDEISSATNDDVVINTTTTSDSDSARPSVIAKITNKNHSIPSMKVINGVHHNIKKTISVVPVNNMIVIDGANLPKNSVNKRLPLIQQPTKRRRVVYSAKSQRVTYQHSPQQKMHSFEKRISTPTIKLPMTKIINLPPSISIRPVIVTNNNTSVQQQKICDNQLSNKQKQHTTVMNSQRQNNNNEKKFESYDNCYCKSPVGTFIAANRRVEYHDFEGDHRRQQSEKQHRWLVDALRLGGLEVTAVPLNSSENSSGIVGIDVDSINLQQQRKKHCEVSFESLFTMNQQNDGNSYSHLDENSDSVSMTVTPDVCILNKSQQPQISHFQQLSSGDVSISTQLGVSQQYHPVHITNKNPALHEKINQAINSLKQQNQSSTLTNNRNSNLIVMDSTNYQHFNDLTVKSSSNTTTRQQRCIVNKNVQERGQIVSPFHSIATMRSAATNLEITIVPVSASTTDNYKTNSAKKTGMQQQKKFGSHNNFTDSLESTSTLFSSSSMERQNVVSPLILNILYNDKNKQNLPSSRPTVSTTDSQKIIENETTKQKKLNQ